MLGSRHDSSNLGREKDGGWFSKGKKERMCNMDVIFAVAS
jgi:hypothetical protein